MLKGLGCGALEGEYMSCHWRLAGVRKQLAAITTSLERLD